MPKDDIDLTEVTKSVIEVKKCFEDFKAASEEREKALLKKQDVDPLLEEKLVKINDSITGHQDLIDKLYAATREKSIMLDGKKVSQEELEVKAQHFAIAAARHRGVKDFDYTPEQHAEYKTAFYQALRMDDRLLSAEQLKALSVGRDPEGGYTVDADTSGRISKKVFETSDIRQFASIQVISTDALEGLYDLEEADSGWAGETGTRVETGTPKLKQWRIPVHEMYAEPKATQKILDDSSVDIEAWLSGKVADKFIRTENAAFVNGTGVDQPRGFSTYSAGTTYPGQVPQLRTGVNGGFAADPAGGDKLIQMVYTLKAPYRRNAVWAANRTTTFGFRLLKDSDGRHLWQPSLTAGEPSTLLGYALTSFEDLPDYTVTDAPAVWFADWSEFYQIVDRMGNRVIRDPYTAKPFVKFYTTRRVGGDVINFEAGVSLAFGA